MTLSTWTLELRAPYLKFGFVEKMHGVTHCRGQSKILYECLKTRAILSAGL